MAIVATTVSSSSQCGSVKYVDYLCTDSDGNGHRWGPVIVPLSFDEELYKDQIAVIVNDYLVNREIEQVIDNG